MFKKFIGLLLTTVFLVVLFFMPGIAVADFIDPVVTPADAWLLSSDPDSSIILTYPVAPNVKGLEDVRSATNLIKPPVLFTAEGNTITVFPPGNGQTGGITFMPQRLSSGDNTNWVNVRVAGPYLTLTLVDSQPGKAVFKVHAQASPWNPLPVVGETIYLKSQCKDKGQPVFGANLMGWPIALYTYAVGITDAQGDSILTVNFDKTIDGNVRMLAVSGLDSSLDIDRKDFRLIAQTLAVADQNNNGQYSWQYAQIDGGVALGLPFVPVLMGDDATITWTGITAPGGWSDAFEITPAFISDVSPGTLVPPAVPPGGSDGAPELGPAPPVEDLPDGTLIGRMPGYIPLGLPVRIDNPGEEIVLDIATIKPEYADLVPTVYYWHKQSEHWVALASYSDDSKVRSINDGNYSGWFMVFGVIKPEFTDAENHWAEQASNRMNGLNFLEGYPAPDGGLLRPARLERSVTRSEYVSIITRILGLNAGDKMYDIINPVGPDEADSILSQFSDSVDSWAKVNVATAVKAGLVSGRDGKFEGDQPITRIEAAAVVSRALKKLPGYQDADLSRYADASDVPAWAKAAVADGVLVGDDGKIRPNDYITRAESLVVLIKLLRGLGW